MAKKNSKKYNITNELVRNKNEQMILNPRLVMGKSISRIGAEIL